MMIHDNFRNRPTIKLGEKSSVELSTRVIPFGEVEAKLKTANTMTPLNMVNNKGEGDIINVTCHVNVCEEPGEVDTSYGRKIKLNVFINDDTVRNPIRLTLWGCHVSKVATGSYRFKELRVKNFNGKYLTTTSHTEIVQCEQKFKLLPQTQTTTTSKTVNFPADTISKLEEVYYCKSCNFKVMVKGRFGICHHCQGKSLLGERYFSVKLTFRTNSDILKLNLPNQLFKDFVKMVDGDLNKLEDIEAALLEVDNIKAEYNTFTNAILSISKEWAIMYLHLNTTISSWNVFCFY